MATKTVTNDGISISANLNAIKVTNLALNDTSDVILLPPGVQNARLYCYPSVGGATFSVNVESSPNNKQSTMLPIATATNVNPCVLVAGPLGAALRLVCTAVSSGNLDCFLVVG